jgi:putative glutathione S-transferase
VTLIRFDVAYVPIFACNLRTIRYDYPYLSRWLRRMYWDTSKESNGGVFGKTSYFEVYKVGYARAKARRLGIEYGKEMVVPRGFEVDIWPVGWEVELKKGDEAEVRVVGGKANGDV